MTKIYIEEISLISLYQKFILILTSNNKIIIYNVFSKEKIFNDFLDLESNNFNIFQTKIDEIFFINIKKIIISANSFNPYKNITNKIIFYLNPMNCSLIYDGNEINKEELNFMKEKNENNKSLYTLIISKIDSKDIKNLKEIEYIKNSSESNIIYDKIIKNEFLGNEEEIEKNVEKLKRISKNNRRFYYVFEDYERIQKEINNNLNMDIDDNDDLNDNNNNNRNGEYIDINYIEMKKIKNKFNKRKKRK
jgi:hypothetical protein